MSNRKRKAPADEVAAGNTVPERGASRFDYPASRSSASPLAADSYFLNLYASEPNFRQLASQDAAFAAIYRDDGKLDFNDPLAMMQLTKTLLKVDFGLKIELPDDRLCPPVPNRHNYILWLKRLLDTSSYEPSGRKICGVDIGTGASCIYPLLGTAQRPWRFVATDIDPKSLDYARRNVRLNGLEDRIQVLERERASPLIPLSDLPVESVDFVMMNPPFYSSEDEMLSSAQRKERPPHSACTGAPVEMVCEGGEVAYIGRMMDESLVLRDRVQWYTAMVGKASSIETLVERLRKNNIDNFAVTEFVQGNKTRRWALGWSFGPMRPAEEVARGIKATPWRNVLPPPSRAVLLILPSGREVSPLVNRITAVRLSTTTVGLVALSDFRKRRAEVFEQQEREARETLLSRNGGANASSATATPPDRSLTATPNNASDSGETDKARRKKKRVKALVSFGGEEEEGEEEGPVVVKRKKKGEVKGGEGGKEEEEEGGDKKERETRGGRKIGANSSVGIVPRALTKAALRREAAEREALRKEFLLLQAAVKASEIAIPFVFYDGTNIPGGMVRVKKGDFIWVFLDKSRKVGAELGVGGEKSATARRDWARVGVDDLMLVRGSIIIPHHYEFYFFIMNKTMGPEGKPLFDYSAEAPLKDGASDSAPASVGGVLKGGPDINTLEGASDDPTVTKVVDRRWYQRNKHIYPASVWQEFEPEKDYRSEIRRDPGGNAFFFSK
ncbi:hypothetical protein QBC34DRAFT_450998 [Podospora aff. communis PSN243]|uniref:FAM50A/XAP5 C-terminal domain-containing protein n=1 Tax=Podospora aff. communis PSN243 TaxID=3040156 RepID=A0AAV9GD26_9PEZI|nr:hypothetical protein QBC34DRAFT_450998 [Podospora aff. communis PSN243]